MTIPEGCVRSTQVKSRLYVILFTYFSVIRVFICIFFPDGNTLQFLTYSLISCIYLYVFFLVPLGNRINETIHYFRCELYKLCNTYALQISGLWLLLQTVALSKLDFRIILIKP